MALTASHMASLGSMAPMFSLPDTQGKIVQLTDYQQPALLVIFMCNHCPFVVHIHDVLIRWISTYQAQGLAVVAINANDAVKYPQDGPEAMKQMHDTHGYSFPYLFDATQETARAYQAACTPDFFLYNQERKLVYRGQFDASRPGSDIPVTGDHLAAACQALLSLGHVPDTISQLPSLGCNIKWKDDVG